MSTHGLNLTGHWKLEVIGPDGKVKDTREKKNLIVTAGLNFLREFILDSVTPTSAARMGWIAIGSDATAVAAGNTALGTQLAREAVETYTAGGTGVASIDNTFGAGVGTGTVAEAGVFNAFWRTGLVKYDGLKGIDWSWLSMDGAMTKAPVAGSKKPGRIRRTGANKASSAAC